MSYVIGGILFDTVTHAHVALLHDLGLNARALPDAIGLDEATRMGFLNTAIGAYGHCTLLMNRFHPYDCSFEDEGYSAFDRRLAELSNEAIVLCFALNGHSGNSSFALFRDGARVRRRSVSPDGVLVDEGEPLPAELPFDPSDTDDEARIFALSGAILGTPLDELIFENSVRLDVYETR